MRTYFLFLGLLFAWASSAWADTATSVGTVQTVRGQAFVTTAGKQVTAAVGTPVFAGSVLSTGGQSSLGVVFQDATVMSIGSQTTLTVDNYVFSPSSGQLAFVTKLAKGTMGYLSGAIAKLKPQSVSLHTTSGTIGIRGTRVAAMEGEGVSHVTLLPDPDGNVGQITMTNTSGTQFLSQSYTRAYFIAPVAPVSVTPNTVGLEFADVLAAFPPQPVLPLSGGAGAQASVTAATGGTSTGLLVVGGLAAAVVAEGLKTNNGTTGSR